MRASGWLTPALRALQATDSAHFGVTGRALMHFFRLVALVIDARAWFERFWPEMERHARDCVLLAVCWVCPGVLRWLFMCNKLISLCVQHDASIGTCLLGVGGGVVAKNMAL